MGLKGRRKKKAAGPASLPKRSTSDHGETIGVSSGGPSPAWVRMLEKRKQKDQAKEQQTTLPGLIERQPQARKVALSVLEAKELNPLEPGRLRDYHVSVKCPYCIAEGYVKATGWPDPCRARVADYVECHDTSSAEQIGHHYACPYWDHTDGTPF